MEQNLKEKPKQVFYIVSRHSKEPIRDFQQLLERMSRVWDLNIIQNTQTTASISNNLGYSTSFELVKNQRFEDQGFRICIKLIICVEDETTFQSIRKLLMESRWMYHIFSESFQAFIPRDLEIVVDQVGEYNIEIHRIFQNFGLSPLYYHQGKHIYYALNKKNEVVIVNRALINFLFEKEIPETEIGELQYVVAPNVQKFAYMDDRNLIPNNFYKFYRKSHKIINDSDFDIYNIRRKVFIKPYIMELQEERNEFYTYAGDGSSLLFMDKIRRGETLDQSIKRVLSEELKVADDYIGAHIVEDVEFDRDRDGVITPRLIIMVYVEKINNHDWSIKMSQTSWRSLDGSLASKPGEQS